MTIDKAIEILGDILHTTCLDRRIDENHAVKLGIEALKHQQTCPYFEYQAKDELSPSETKD